jgi:hypothetical protein
MARFRPKAAPHADVTDPVVVQGHTPGSDTSLSAMLVAMQAAAGECLRLCPTTFRRKLPTDQDTV